MNTIGELLSRDLNRKIEEVIQVHQAEESSVHSEITEYIATGSIKDQYAQLLKAIADGPAEATESVGVWVSGFFGSGKSSFAKNLGYALQNRSVLGQNFATLFKDRIEDERVGGLLDLINSRTPTEVILFEVAKELDTRQATQRIAELMYVVLLRELGYAEDWDIAELEIELEGENKLDEFLAQCKQIHGKEWKTFRIGAQKASRASAVLHRLDPVTYPNADSWAHARRGRETSITVSRVVERCFELCRRRRPGKALVFIIDEVGQHVAQSGDKIEDLRATVEEFGKVGKNLLKARSIPAPAWVVVTSQERLDEVVAAIDSKRIDLAKLQDRFRHRVDLAPSDIREVATKRVLGKRPEAVPVLKKLYGENQGALNAALRLERTTRKTEVTEDEFVQFYPYPPHFIDLCISIMSGVRLLPGATRHLGGSNRTIIKQAYEMLVSERTAFASKPVGALVTLDKVFELVEGNLSNEVRRDIHDISLRFKDRPDLQSWCLRVVKVICLLEFLRDLPRTEANIAALLVDEVGKPAPLGQVQAAVKGLYEAQFVRNTEDGWKLQTAAEKTWDNERKALSPRPRDRNEITHQTLREIFDEPAFKTFRYKELRSFPVGVSVDGTELTTGDLPLCLALADAPEDFPKRLDETRSESRLDSNKNNVYWVFNLTAEIDQLVAEVYASRKMVEKYGQLRAQQKITHLESSCLDQEARTRDGHQSRLHDKMAETLEKGTGLFQGVSRDASSLGKNLSEILKKLFAQVVPDLYPKLEMGARSLKGTEADEILKAADLKSLSPIFYETERGLGLVVKDGAKHVPNPKADTAKEVLDHLVSRQDYGDHDACTGKALEKKFGGLGYGWDRDMLRLILAVLFRAGCIQITHGGEKFESYQEPRSRTPLTSNPAFKSARFTPIKPIDRKTLTQAVESYEHLTGETVDVDKNAIAEAVKKFATQELKQVIPVEVQAKAHHLPVAEALQNFRESLTAIEGGSADDCVTTLAGGGASLKEALERCRKIAACLNEAGLTTIRHARLALGEVWSQLQSRGRTDLEPQAEVLKTLLAAADFYEKLPAIREATRLLLTAYKALYQEQHADRTERFQAAVDKVKGTPDWNTVAEAMRGPLLGPLTTRICTALDHQDGEVVCRSCRATVSQMESDLAALDGLTARVVAQIQKLTTPPEVQVRRVRAAEFFSGSLASEEQVREAVNRLQDHLLVLLDEGIKIVVE